MQHAAPPTLNTDAETRRWIVHSADSPWLSPRPPHQSATGEIVVGQIGDATGGYDGVAAVSPASGSVAGAKLVGSEPSEPSTHAHEMVSKPSWRAAAQLHLAICANTVGPAM
ncbi:hypothetical protein ACEQ8H_001871 [Pleosporales sp. CAS-2024a]